MVPDKESDIKPRFHKSKSHTQKHTDGDAVCIIIEKSDTKCIKEQTCNKTVCIATDG